MSANFGAASLLFLAGCGAPSNTQSSAGGTLPVQEAAAAFRKTIDQTREQVLQRLPASGYVDNSLIPSLDDLDTAPPFTEIVSLRVGAPWVFNDETAPWFIAQDLGYFKEAGLEVDLVEGGPGRNPMTLLLADKLDIAVTADSGNVPAAISSVTGGDVVIVSTVLKKSPVSVVTLDTSVPNSQRSDLSFSPLDMRGKIFGVQAGSERLANIFLRSNGLPDGEVEIARIGNSPDLLTTGRVDFMLAWIVNQPRMLEAQGYMNWASFPLSDYFYSSPADVSVVTRSFHQGRSDVIWRYNWAVLKAVRHLLDHSEEAAELTYGRVEDSGLSAAQILRRFELQRPLIEGDYPEQLMHVSIKWMNDLVAYHTQAGMIELPPPD